MMDNFRPKREIVDRVAKSVSQKINSKLRDNIYKTDVELIIDTFIKECRNVVIEGGALTMRSFMRVHLEDTNPKMVYSNFRGRKMTHLVGPSKVIRMVPSQSLKDAVWAKHSHPVELQEDE